MADPRHRRPHQARLLHLGVEERDRQGQLGRREQLLADPREDLLRRQPVDQALAKGVEEVRLLDVFFALEHGHGRLLASPWAFNGRADARGLPASTAIAAGDDVDRIIITGRKDMPPSGTCRRFRLPDSLARQPMVSSILTGRCVTSTAFEADEKPK